MTLVDHQWKENILTLFLKGQIDSANAAAVEAEVEKARAARSAEAIVVDCSALQYLSSAGLRVILRLKKAVPDTKLINVSAEVYEVFDMTGFTEMMEIQKAYRVISVQGCAVIGQGANGVVYRIDRDTIIKVYRNPDALPEIRRERELARTAFVLGVPTAIPYDVVRVQGGGYGSVFELLNASSFAQLLISGEKTVDEIAKMSIDLLKTIHSTVVAPDSMPDMRAIALGWADLLKDHLPTPEYEKLHALIAAVPEDLHMLHGDYHIKNIMLQNGESLLIDMDSLCHGHPVFELAGMFNAYVGFSETDRAVSQRFLGIPYDQSNELWQKSLRLYLDGAEEKTVRSVEEKAMVVGYMRLLRRHIRLGGYKTENGRLEIENCRRRLEERIARVDTLAF